MHPTDEPHRQKRSHLKVRTGCATCKTRRVKCDEVHPECGRCRTANRKCVYAVPKTWLFEPKREAAVLHSQPKIALGSPQEQRAFQFFREKTAPQFAGHQDLAQRFWCRHIVTTAAEDSLIFKMAVAMGARHEASIYNSSESSALASSCHATALSTLARQLSTMRVDLSLLCCAMLMGYANLCEEVPATAAIHFSLGLKILRDETVPGPRDSLDAMSAYIDPMFAELELATAVFQVPSHSVGIIFSETEGPPTLPPEPQAFQNLHEAKQCLADIHRWLLYVTIRQNSSMHTITTESIQIDLLLTEWRRTLARYAASVSKDLPLYHKARKMMFQYKLFVMCRGAAKNAIFNDVCRVSMVSVDFRRPHMTSVICNLRNTSSDASWIPLANQNGRERDDLEIWPQGESVGQDGDSKVIRITLGG